MKGNFFDKKAFVQSARDNVKDLYRKTLEEAGATHFCDDPKKMLAILKEMI